LPFEKYDLTSLQHEMEYFGISEALVTHQSAIFRPKEGNDKLLEQIKDYSNLHACWVLLPDFTGEILESTKLIEEMLEKGVRVVRLYPKLHEYDLDKFSGGKLLNLLNKYHLPTIIPSRLGWTEIAEIADNYPNIALILSSHYLFNTGSTASLNPLRYICDYNRHVYSLLKRSENIFIDVSCYPLHRGIEDICQNFSSRRLLFGTEYPHSPIASSMSLVDYAEIDEKDKRLIAGDNIRNLIAEVKYQTKPKPSPRKDIIPLTEKLKDYCQGETVIDVHGHIGTYYMRKTPGDSPEEIIKIMDRLGIDRMYFSIVPDVMESDYRTCNDMAIELSKRHRERLKAYMVVLPGNYPEELEEELSRCYREGVKGIKVYPVIEHKNRPLSDKIYDPVWKFASAHNLPILSHSEGSPPADPTNFDRIARDYPEVKFIIAHLGAPKQPFYIAIDKCKEVMQKRDNVYVDLSGIWLFGPVEEVTKELDINRILFGTDATWHPIPPVLSMVVTARISDKDKRKILGLNAKKLFRI